MNFDFKISKVDHSVFISFRVNSVPLLFYLVIFSSCEMSSSLQFSIMKEFIQFNMDRRCISIGEELCFWASKVDISIGLFIFVIFLANLDFLSFQFQIPFTVRTTRPEKCDIFAQRYQSHALTAKFQTRC